MQKYVILCETIHRAKQLWCRTAKVLGYRKYSVSEYPMYNMKTIDGKVLYFTSIEYWYDKGCIGRRDWKSISERNFEDALDYFVENKENSNETDKNYL